MKREYALEVIGEFMCRESARLRMESRVSRKMEEASFGHDRRFTGKLKLVISSRSHFSSPFEDRGINFWSAALPGVVLPWIHAGDTLVAR